MSEKNGTERILVLVDDSPGAESAVEAATRIAAATGLPLTILGVSRAGDDGAAAETALGAAHARAASRVSSVETTRTTGDILEAAARRVSETPTALVVLGARPGPGRPRRWIGPEVWTLVKMLAPPALITAPAEFSPRSALFCTGGERFIEEGARFAARIAAGLRVAVTVFHVSPDLPGMYGDRLRDSEISPQEFLASNSRIARNVSRQVEIFRAAGAEVVLRLAVGDVVARVLEEVRRERHDLLIVGSSPVRGAFQTYMLGDRMRDIAGAAGRPFLVLRSKPAGFWTEIWRSLKEGAAAGAVEKAEKVEKTEKVEKGEKETKPPTR